MRKSPTGGKAGSGSDGCVGVREDAVLERTDSEIILRLGSDPLAVGVMIERKRVENDR